MNGDLDSGNSSSSNLDEINDDRYVKSKTDETDNSMAAIPSSPTAETPVVVEFNLCKTPAFDKVNHSIFPIIKPWRWFKRAKDLLQKQPNKSPLAMRTLGATEFGVAYAIQHYEQGTRKYVNQSDLQSWAMKEKDLEKIAKENLIYLAETLTNEGKNLFQETQTGIFYCDKMDELTSSLVMIPNVFAKTGIQEDKIVIQIPKSNLILASDSSNAMALCVMGELSFKYKTVDHFLSTQPLRLLSNGWLPYEPNKADGEFPVPQNKDHIRIYRKAIFKH